MNNATVIARLCGLPSEFRTRGNVSMIDLIRDSGYLEIANRVFESDIEEYLREHADLVDVWQVYSEDQRCTPTCYLASASFAGRPGDSGWRVGYYSMLPAERVERDFQDGYSACAYFVKRFAEDLRALAEAG
jgi:hypothetical protein